MKLTIEGTKDEVAALVRGLCGNEKLPGAEGFGRTSWLPTPVPHANPADTTTSGVSTSGVVSTMSTSGGPVDPVVVAMNTIAEAHREPFSAREDAE